MRFVLVDGQTDRVCADIAAGKRMSTRDSGKLERFCKILARIADKNRGQQRGAYDFSCFAPSGNQRGYFIFEANEQGLKPLCSHDEGCPATLSEVLNSCIYVGYVSPRFR